MPPLSQSRMHTYARTCQARHLNPLTMKEKQILVDFGKDLNGANDNEASSGSYHSNSYNQRGKAAQVWLYLQSKGPSTVIPLYQGSSDSVETEEEDKDAAAALSAATSVPVSGVVSLSSSPLSERENADIDRAVHDIHFANDDTGDDANAPGSTSCDNGDRDTRSETKRDQRSRGKKDRRRGRDKNKSGGTFSKKEEQGKGHPHLHLFKPLISSLNIIRTESNHTRMNVDTGSDRAGGVSVRYFPVAVDACSVSAANNSAIVVSEGGYSNTTHSSSNSSSDRSQNEGVGAQSQQQRQLLSFNLRYFPMDFMQINANVNQQMICKSLNLLDPQPDDLILDLFCGLGNFGIPIAGCIKAHTHAPLSPSSSTATAPAAVPLQVLGFDVDEGMIMRANDNAKQNDLSGDMIQFFPANLYEEGGIALLKAQVQRFTSTDASAASETSAASVPIRGVKVVIDPPRSGALELLRDDFFWQRADADIEADDCGNGNSEHRGGDGSEKDYGSSLQSRRWEINRIVYVSCNPATFARDADILVNKHGFRLSQTGIADMFPHTSQSECVSLFER